MSDILAFLAKHWLPWSIWALVALANAARTGTLPSFVRVPSKYLPLVVIVAGELGTSLVAVSNGAPAGPALLHGLEVAVWSMGLYDVVTRAFPGLAARFPWLGWLVAYVPKPSPDEEQRPGAVVDHGSGESAPAIDVRSEPDPWKENDTSKVD